MMTMSAITLIINSCICQAKAEKQKDINKKIRQGI